MTALRITPDPALDLVLDRVVDVPPELVWEAWTTPEHFKEWFVPRPWSLASCELDLKPGGAFNTVMRSPEGEEFPNLGCVLEVTPKSRLVFTDALHAGFRPAPKPFMTAIVDITPEGAGTRYVATALHADVEARDRHDQMGFLDGWGTVLDQLVAYMKTKKR